MEDLQMNNPKVYQILSIMGFVVSAVFTIKLFSSNSTDIISWLSMVTMALLYEFGKYILLFQAIKGPFGTTGKSIMLGIWLMITIASIVASANYVLNDSNVQHNKMVQGSTAYANQQNSIKIQNDLYATTTKVMEDLKSQKVKQQIEGDKIVAAMPSNYIDKRNAQREATQYKIQDTQNQINAKADSLLTIAAGITKAPEKLENNLAPTSGGESMFRLIAKKTDYTAEEIGITFYILIGVGLELLANLFAFLSQYYKYGGLKITPPLHKKPIPVPAVSHKEEHKENVIQGGRLSGMKYKFKTPHKISKNSHQSICIGKPIEKQHENNVVDFEKQHKNKNEKTMNADMKIYLDFAKNNLKENGDLPSISYISKGIGFAPEKCRTIHNRLKDKGIIETSQSPRRTYLVKAVV